MPDYSYFNCKACSSLQGGMISQRLFIELIVGQELQMIHSDIILDTIKKLEFENKEFGSLKFQRPPLQDFYKAHYTSPNDLIINMKNAFINNSEDPSLMEFRNKKNGVINDVVNKINQGQQNDELSVKIANLLTIDAIEANRNSNIGLTGEWIVFYRKNSINYYLTLAEHNEEGGGQTRDQAILSRVNKYKEIIDSENNIQKYFIDKNFKIQS